MHFLPCLQIIWYHNFYCCSSYHEWVQKGLKVKHQANKLHCLVPVVLDELQTMRIEQPGNTEQSELVQWPLWAGSRCGTSMTPPQPLGFLPVCAFTPVHMQVHDEEWLFWLWKPGLTTSQMLQFWAHLSIAWIWEGHCLSSDGHVYCQALSNQWGGYLIAQISRQLNFPYKRCCFFFG